MNGIPINTSTLKSLRVGRFRRTALLLGVAGATVGGMLLGAGCSHASAGQNPAAATAAAAAAGGGVSLSPASGATNSTPTWSTTAGCPKGFQGSGIFRAINTAGQTYSISGATNSVIGPFRGTLLANLEEVGSLSGLPGGGGTQELVIVCFSGDSLTGTSQREVHTFITYKANGTYTTSATRP